MSRVTTMPARAAFIVVATLLCSASSIPAFSQDYPSKPIRWLVPFSPGGSGDALARVMAQSLAESMGQPILVENRPGGNTIVAAAAAARSEPDGYTVLQTNHPAVTMIPFAYESLPYKASDFAPIGMLVEQPQVFSINVANISAKSLPEFIAYAKAHPGKVNFGVGSLGSQVTAELIKAAMGIKVATVPFKGGGETVKALVAGTIDVGLSDTTPVLRHIGSGRLKALATTGLRRSSSLPEVPTLIEAGYQINAPSWFGLFAPAGTPESIVLKLNREINKALNTPTVRDRLLSFGLHPVTTSPEEFAKRIRDESNRWAKIIRENGIKR